MEVLLPEPKLAPMGHQLQVFNDTWQSRQWALFADMGTGKTRIVLDTAVNLALHGKIKRVLVVAPRFVHENWVEIEIPKHVMVPCEAVTYHANKANTKWHQSELNQLLSTKKLAVLSITYDAIKTKKGFAFAEQFLKGAPTLMVLDESTRVKSWKSQITRTCLKLGKMAAGRRIMTGTPAANRPTDVYYQMQFLHPDFWKQHGFRNKTVFDAHFCLFSNVPMGGRTIQQVIGYKNQEQLRDILATMSTRLRQEDVLPHLPPQRWQEFPFDLTPHQLRLYDELDAEVADLLQNYGVGEDDDLADQKLRLMDQVASGFMYENVDEKNRVTHDMPDNPRLDALKAIVEDNEKPLVIWATYVREVEHIFQAFPGRCVGVEDRRRWHAGEKQLLVMKPSQCAEGLTLNEADTSVFYSNSFKADDRWQAEKRNHRMGQDNPVLYIDLVGRKTRDRHKLHALRNKWDYQAFIMNEEGRKWRTNC